MAGVNIHGAGCRNKENSSYIRSFQSSNTTKFFSPNCHSVQEYENQCTAEAKFVKQLDQCEMILQAFEYEELEKTPGRLQEFYDSTAGMTSGLVFFFFCR